MRSFLLLSAGAGITLLSSSVLFGDVSNSALTATEYSEPAAVVHSIDDGAKNSRRQGTLSVEQFVKEVALNGLSDQTLSRLALERSRNLRVNLLAEGVIKDNEAIAAALKAVADSERIAIPDKLNVEYQAALSSLKLQQPEQFDTAYVLQMRQNYLKAVTLLEQAEGNPAIDPKLREFAEKSLSVLRDREGQLQAMNVPVKAPRMITAAQ